MYLYICISMRMCTHTSTTHTYTRTYAHKRKLMYLKRTLLHPSIQQPPHEKLGYEKQKNEARIILTIYIPSDSFSVRVQQTHACAAEGNSVGTDIFFCLLRCAFFLPSLSHSLTHSLAHSLTHYSLTHSLID